MAEQADGRPVVRCLDCDLPLRSSASRARRIGSLCWRRRRAIARRAAPPTLPGMPAGPGRSAQTGPDLLDDHDGDQPTAEPA